MTNKQNAMIDETTTEGEGMNVGARVRWYHGKRTDDGPRWSWVTLVRKVTGGWIVRVADGTLVGPIQANPYTGLESS